jgi:arabinogalactan endo-1,4-beta-galactosidase
MVSVTTRQVKQPRAPKSFEELNWERAERAVNEFPAYTFQTEQDANGYTVIRVRAPNNQDGYVVDLGAGTCTCRDWDKVCRHSLGITHCKHQTATAMHLVDPMVDDGPEPVVPAVEEWRQAESATARLARQVAADGWPE